VIEAKNETKVPYLVKKRQPRKDITTGRYNGLSPSRTTYREEEYLGTYKLPSRDLRRYPVVGDRQGHYSKVGELR
jgi:hypothetical protein